MSAPVKVGDKFRLDQHNHGMTARVMAVAEGYAMVRYPRCTPFIVPVKELDLYAQPLAADEGADCGDL